MTFPQMVRATCRPYTTHVAYSDTVRSFGVYPQSLILRLGIIEKDLGHFSVMDSRPVQGVHLNIELLHETEVGLRPNRMSYPVSYVACLVVILYTSYNVNITVIIINGPGSFTWLYLSGSVLYPTCIELNNIVTVLNFHTSLVLCYIIYIIVHNPEKKQVNGTGRERKKRVGFRENMVSILLSNCPASD